MRKFILALGLALTCVAGASGQNEAKFSYTPELDGVIRARAEVDTETGDSRLAVRNARLSVRGHVAAPVTYFLQADFCDQGKFVMLDAYIQGVLGHGWTLRGGQFRVPFGRDVFRIPGKYVFVNRSFIARDILNMRAVGGQASYAVPGVPLTVTAGVFSPEAISSHTKWTTKYTYAAKATWVSGGWHLEVSGVSACTDSVRYNIADAAVTYTHGRWTVEGEYAYKHYTNQAFKACHAYNVWGSYAIPTRLPLFKTWSWQARFDGTTAHSTGTRGADGLLVENQPRRNRVTAGTTLQAPLPHGSLLSIHLNYEKYFYPEGYKAPDTRRDAVCAEIALLF